MNETKKGKEKERKRENVTEMKQFVLGLPYLGSVVLNQLFKRILSEISVEKSTLKDLHYQI